MKVKPKDVLVNLPIALLFEEPWEISSFAANINAVLHGKVKLKAEDLGTLGGRYVGLFYLQRNDEFHHIRDEFVRLIEEEQINNYTPPEPFIPSDLPPPIVYDTSYTEPATEPELEEVEELEYDPNYDDYKMCLCGHPYYRHFDTYNNMEPIGCKYCYKDTATYDSTHCAGFKAKE